MCLLLFLIFSLTSLKTFLPANWLVGERHRKKKEAEIVLHASKNLNTWKQPWGGSVLLFWHSRGRGWTLPSLFLRHLFTSTRAIFIGWAPVRVSFADELSLMICGKCLMPVSYKRAHAHTYTKGRLSHWPSFILGCVLRKIACWLSEKGDIKAVSFWIYYTSTACTLQVIVLWIKRDGTDV